MEKGQNIKKIPNPHTAPGLKSTRALCKLLIKYCSHVQISNSNPPAGPCCQHLILLSSAEQGEGETPLPYTHAHRFKL